MTKLEKQEIIVVVSVLVAVSIAMIISMCVKFNIYDFAYFIVCIVFLIRYLRIKLKR